MGFFFFEKSIKYESNLQILKCCYPVKGGIYPSACNLLVARDWVVLTITCKCTFSGAPLTTRISMIPAVCPDKPSRYSDTCPSLRNRTVREDYLFFSPFFFFVGPLNFRGYRGIIGSFTSTQTSILRAEDGLQC